MAVRASKVCKGWLADDRNNLMLWTAYARLEYSRGNVPSARAVLCKALSNARVRSSSEDAHAISAAWAMMEWELGHHDRAQQVMLRLVDQKPTGELDGSAQRGRGVADETEYLMGDLGDWDAAPPVVLLKANSVSLAVLPSAPVADFSSTTSIPQSRLPTPISSSPVCGRIEMGLSRFKTCAFVR